MGVGVECAIAIGYLLRSLRRCLCILPWGLSITLVIATVVDIVIVPKYCEDHSHMLTAAIGTLTATALSCACLVIVAYRGRHSSDTVAARHRRSAAVWIANALLSNVPMAIAGLAPFLLQQPQWFLWILVQGTVMSSKGALNTLAIFCSSRYSSMATIQDVGRLDNPGSFNVHWGGHEEIIIT